MSAEVIVNGVRYIPEDTLPPRRDDQLLEPPYCQVVGRNAAVLLRRDQIEWISRKADEYGTTIALDIGGEMRRALLELDIAARAAARSTHTEETK